MSREGRSVTLPPPRPNWAKGCAGPLKTFGFRSPAQDEPAPTLLRNLAPRCSSAHAIVDGPALLAGVPGLLFNLGNSVALAVRNQRSVHGLPLESGARRRMVVTPSYSSASWSWEATATISAMARAWAPSMLVAMPAAKVFPKSLATFQWYSSGDHSSCSIQMT